MAIETFISREKIHKTNLDLAKQICRDYEGQDVIFVGILNGSFMFCADLVRACFEVGGLSSASVEFMGASSYGDGTESSGELNITLDLKRDIKDKNVIIVEDIVDTGLTLSKLLKVLEKRSPKTLKLASLLYKPARNVHEVNINYLGIEIEDKFVIGYGLDYAGKYRELPFIGVYSEN